MFFLMRHNEFGNSFSAIGLTAQEKAAQIQGRSYLFFSSELQVTRNLPHRIFGGQRQDGLDRSQPRPRPRGQKP